MELFGTIIMGHVEAYVIEYNTYSRWYRLEDCVGSKVLPHYVMPLLCIHQCELQSYRTMFILTEFPKRITLSKTYFSCKPSLSDVISVQDFSYDDPKLEFNVDAPNGVVMEGYLFKRASNAFKTWNR